MTDERPPIEVSALAAELGVTYDELVLRVHNLIGQEGEDAVIADRRIFLTREAEAVLRAQLGRLYDLMADPRIDADANDVQAAQ